MTEKMIYLILLFTILFFILAWRRLDWAVMFLIASLPVYLIRFNIYGLPLTLLEMMIWAVFIVWLLKSYRNIIENLKLKIVNWKNTIPLSPPLSRGQKRYPFDWEIVLLLTVALAAAGVAGFSASSLGIWKAYFFEPVLFFIVVLNLMAQKPPSPPFVRGVELVLWPLAVSALAVSLLAICQKVTGQLIDNPVWAAEETRRVVSFFGYPNAVGLYLAPLVLVMVGWLFSLSFPKPQAVGNPGVSSTNMFLDSRLRGNDKIKIVFIVSVIILSLLSIYFAKSKGAFLGVAAGLVVFGLLAGKKIRWATVVAVLIAAAGILSYQPAKKVVLDTITFKTLSGQIRMAGWADGWQMLKDGRLITGAGLANYQRAIAPYHTEGIFIKDYSDPLAQRKLVFNDVYRKAHWQPLEIYLYPHNIIFNFWSELGLAGALLFIWIILKYFWTGTCVLSLRGASFNSVIAAAACPVPRYGEPQSRSVNEAETRIPCPSGRRAACAGMTKGEESFVMTDKYLNIGLLCAMVAIVVHGLVDVPYFKNDLAVMFWLFLAMMSIINLNKNYGKDL